MTREQLRDLGLADDVINSIMGMHGKDIQGLQAQLATQQATLAKATADLKTLQSAQVKEEKPKEPEVNPEMKALQEQIAQLQAENRIKDLRAYANDNKIIGEQAEAIINAFGDNLDLGRAAIDSIAKIISDTSETVKKATEQSLMLNTPNPQGSASAKADVKPDDVKNAEGITFATVSDNAKSARDFYK